MRRWALLLLLIAAFSGAKSYGQTCVTASQVTLAGNLRAANGLPSSNYTLSFQPSTQGYIAGCGVNTPQTFSCATSTDGSVVGLPNPLTASIVTTAGTGALTAGTYYSVIAWYDSTGAITLVGPETATVLSASGSLVVNPPSTGQPAGAVGMDVYISTTPGAETLQGQTIGTGSYVQSTALVSGASPVTANSTLCKLTANDAIWPVGTGYITSLTDSHGNSVPGYPMQWQLLGAGTTINLSNGLPYYHGVVQYPVPLLTSPANHGQQSLTGPLNMSGYNITNVGSITACTINGIIHANCLTGYTDLGAKINGAIAQCAQNCTVTVDAGTYNFTTPIVIPMNFFSHLSLQMDGGAALVYNGVGCAITSTINTTSPTVVNLRISGGQLYAGTNSPTCGIHVQASNGVWIGPMVLYGFAAGYGVWVDGANGVWIKDNIIDNNEVGVYATNTLCSGNSCSPTGSGTPYTPNAVHVINNDITGNSHWAVQFYDTFTNQSTGALNDSVESNDLELNGSAGTQYGTVSVGMSTSMVISKNYFEGSPNGIFAGIPGGADGSTRFFASKGLVIRDNYFTLEDTVNPGGTYQINLLDTDNALIEGNGTLGASENASNCFINSLARSGSNIGETSTYLSKNAFYTDENTGLGNYTCVGGVPGPLVGTNTFPIVNTNLLPQILDGNFVTTSATTDVITGLVNVTSNSYCYVEPHDGTANSNSWTAYSAWVVPGATQVTVHHPANAGVHLDIYCATY